MPSENSALNALLAGLNEPQRQAVVHRDGPLLVIAGPGSGKTRVITRRAAYLVQSGVPARNILAITFTNKAADEMRKRVAELGVGQGMWVYTFHALGVRLLREFGALGRVQPGFSIYDEADSVRVIKEAMAIEHVGPHMLPPEQVRNEISRAKNRLRSPTAFLAAAENSDRELIARIYETYEKLLERHNAVDFDDLLMRVALVLQDHPDVAERLNVRFRYVLIDEYQDTNHAQYLIARHLTRHHRNICATGDPDQSIYAWRGADIRNILEFERDYPDAVVVRLEQNYRSTGHILDVASRLIAKNQRRKHKELWSELGAGVEAAVWRFSEGFDEADRIARRIAELRAAGNSYSDVAIIYRVNALSRGLEQALRDSGIPYRIARGVEFYNRREIRDVLAYLRVLVNPADEVAALRIINTPARGIGETTIDRLRTYAAEQGLSLLDAARRAGEMPELKGASKRVQSFATLLTELQPLVEFPVSEAVSLVLKRSGLEKALEAERDEDAAGEDRLANVEELVTAASRYEQDVEDPNLADFLNRISLTSDQDVVDEHAGCVLLMTLHAAKGLEFPVVFIAGLEQGLLPHERALKDGDVEEERRLCFVGMTRAERELILTHADERMICGQVTPRSPSQFLHEIAGDALRVDDFRRRLIRQPAKSPPRDGFVPLVDDLPPEEAERYAPKRRWREREADELDTAPAAHRTRPARVEPQAADPQRPFADWQPGTLVKHERYGVGQIVTIRPSGKNTRALVRFAGHGEKILVLEYAAIQKLSR